MQVLQGYFASHFRLRWWQGIHAFLARLRLLIVADMTGALLCRSRVDNSKVDVLLGWPGRKHSLPVQTSRVP